MKLILDEVPSATEAPPSAEPSRVAVAPERWSRRKVLGSITGVAVATGLGTLGLLPWSRPRGAAADAYREWNDCRGFFDGGTICVPSSAYYGSNNCGGGGWHRHESGNGTCWSSALTHNPTSCAGHNAWRWYGRVGNRKCSDGWYYYKDCGGGYVNSFSICRTNI